MAADPDACDEAARCGLCARCRHVKRVSSARGSAFYLCTLAAIDDRFPKYPPLPVSECVGYTPETE